MVWTKTAKLSSGSNVTEPKVVPEKDLNQKSTTNSFSLRSRTCPVTQVITEKVAGELADKYKAHLYLKKMK